ncbi:membrane protein insertase YidC [Pseudonocardia aurantiaca]|uniref:Membrane protein insertase YidC n=1 Tax=Pseudonocardia aurantiaca TaxID=75290 RepID=A0ABW4FDL5_9PSEU
MLNFIYYPVSFILWVWHEVFGFLLGPDNGLAWALSVMFLVFTLRALLYKPFVSQVRSMRKMQEFQPEIAKLRKKYGNDRQKQAEEMQRLQKEHGVNPLGGCLPVLVQVPVFIGLFHVLREFNPILTNGAPRTENYFFGQTDVQSFNNSHLFGAKLGSWVTQGEAVLNAAGTSIASMLIVMIPLMIAAGIFTHITARHSVARQTAAQAENPQTAIMNKLMLYVFPIGVVVGAPFLPLAVLLYWVSNNLWTLGQQYVVYRRIDAEEAAKKEQTTATRQSLAPRPGQKPVRPEPTAEEPKAKRPGAKPVTRKPGAGNAAASSSKAATNGEASPNGAANGAAAGASEPEPKTNGATGDAPRSARSSGGGSTRPPARRPRKRR